MACPWPTPWPYRPTLFPRVYVAMVQAGETGGFLDLVLAQIADFQAREKELRSKVMTAMLYPLVLLFLALSVLTFLMVFFIPRFKTVLRRLWRQAACDHSNHRGHQRRDGSLRILHPHRPGHHRHDDPKLVHVRRRTANLGKLDFASPSRWTSGGTIRHGPLLPHARDAPGCGCAAGSGPQRCSSLHWQPNPC